MAKPLKLLPLLALASLAAACTTGNDLQRAGVGAATGAAVAGATDNDIATGAAIGGVAGALSDDAARATGRSF
ncbi:hypothetical protein [Tropicimonas isoalkanivorans]|uniref:YMGG-like Gly-zipper n=1 Tax=Tropicimonas isoalkanivorans TaxID=441112 RepID=A0A1I1JGU6_9RHOB|nr:hypothetical protein [Tropicimonas isoalkanivorans]SFC47182.1 hypothetical protein SAMN04488094_10597 [Tropicimonas isoalkanivorans]